jgi:hypothetical protein
MLIIILILSFSHAVFYSAVSADVLSSFKVKDEELPVVYMLSEDGEGLLQYQVLAKKACSSLDDKIDIINFSQSTEVIDGSFMIRMLLIFLLFIINREKYWR